MNAADVIARRLHAAGCRFVGARLNLAMLVFATIVVTAALLLRVFPSWTSRLLAQL